MHSIEDSFISDSSIFDVINTISLELFIFFLSKFTVLVPREITCMNGCPPFWGPQGLCTREAYSSWTFISQRIIHSSHQRYTACTSYLISKLHQSHWRLIEGGMCLMTQHCILIIAACYLRSRKYRSLHIIDQSRI